MKALAIAILFCTSLATLDAAKDGTSLGYDDTPLLPGQKWRVHDKQRPRPPVVAPGVGSAPPSDAIVLFGGDDASAWETTDATDARWMVQDGAMTANHTGSIRTRESFGDIQLHLEWRAPKEVQGDSQGRGNSGVFLMERYEIQVLDSFKNKSYADGQAAAMYGQYPPDVDACRPPGEWQSFDIVFRAPRFTDQELSEPAVLTLFHNGVLVHNARAFLGATAHRAVAQYSPHGERAPISLQDHGNPVSFRNIWLREL